MSLDIYLNTETKKKKRTQEYHSGIFIRDNGQTKEITDKEWEERFPGRTPVRVKQEVMREAEKNEVFHGNITHNLGEMAEAADIYYALWRPEEKGWTKAKDIIPILKKGLTRLITNPVHFKKYNPANGWGEYIVLVRVVIDYLAACKQYPDAKIEVSR
jgi:hypothetical protein